MPNINEQCLMNRACVRKPFYSMHNAMRLKALLAFLAVIVVSSRPALAQRAPVGNSETLIINYQALSKDPGAAAMLSFFPGFGAGHFYSGSTQTGFIAAGGQLVGLGLFLLGAAIGEPGDTTRTALQAVGGTFFVVFKMGDVIYAPFAASNYNVDLAMRMGVPIRGVAPTLELTGPRNNNNNDASRANASRVPDKKPEPPPKPVAPVEGEGFQY